MTAPDVLPLVSTVGGGFLAGALAGYALKKVISLAVVVGLFIAALLLMNINERRLENASNSTDIG